MTSQHNPWGAPALPIHLLAQAVPMLTRHELAALTERLIDALDSMEGDLDLEPNGDELDGSTAEDDYGATANMHTWSHAGCPIADPDQACDDHACDGETDSEPDDYADQFADPIARAEQRKRIQRQRSLPVWSRYSVRGQRERIGHELIIEPAVPTRRQLLRRKRGVPRHPRA